jgi:hypothetical protein
MNIFYVNQLNNFSRLYVASAKYEKLLSPDDAELYVAMLDIDGYTDWTLPTSEAIYHIEYMQKYKYIPDDFHLAKKMAYLTNHPQIITAYTRSMDKRINIANPDGREGVVRPVRMVAC